MNWLRNGLRDVFLGIGVLPSARQILQIPFLAALASDHNIRLQAPLIEQTCGSLALSCPLQPQLPVDTCCINYPAGHYLMTQFWDTSPPLGPDDSWTIHGLWPDYCTGGFPAFCDESRTKSPEELTAILSSAARSTHPDLLKYMIQYWLSNDHRNSNLWSHEWNKHGTCVTTLEPQCYGDSSMSPIESSDPTAASVLDYFMHTTQLFSQLDTFKLLASHNILPSTSITYTLTELEAAIQSSSHAQKVTLRCNSHHELDEIWYHFNILGSLRNATSSSNDIFVPVPPDGQISNCPATGIKYLPKSPSKQPPTHTSPGHHYPPPTSIPSSTPFTGKGHLKIHVLSPPSSNSLQQKQPQTGGGYQGCLIRPGKWYVSGTCATYTASSTINEEQPPHRRLFTLQSSYAPCAILPSSSSHGKKGEFVCDRTLPVQTIFGSANSTSAGDVDAGKVILQQRGDGDENGNGDGDGIVVLSYQNQTIFYADRVPGSFEKVGIFVDDDGGRRDVRVEVFWEGS